MRILIYIAPVFLLLALLSPCERNPYTIAPSDKLSFSTDTVQFDTIFTSIGSTTEYLTVINPYSKAIKIDEIALARGDESVFRLNING